MNYDYNQWILEWNTILEQVRLVRSDGIVPQPIIKEPATQQEIEEIENRLGYQLPSMFRHTLLHFSKSVSLSWDFYKDPLDQALPKEFREGGFGTIEWRMDDIEDLDELAGDLDADVLHIYGIEDENYRSPLHGKLQFMHVANGDIIAFDMQVMGEPSVVYWNHETDELIYLADSFHSFIERLNKLHCVGNEIWAYEPFLTDQGLDPNGHNAQSWRKWFSELVVNHK
ncbi:hypothetical protein J2Z48_000050 [Croceifilum oryzae]|uniref:Knr4/Smi1-like domain-containing protein n=1 Tax=Croceifilum oryzae TaxID=1553429 RepID=A0AAJ1TG24_9BACL|nr:SMI1/KNR4 family protein [Croceifilum oryzae]MDQ0415892.1 hypothetical protein [Croceifilum oryzae]